MYNTLRLKQGNQLKTRKEIIYSSVTVFYGVRSKMCEVTNEAKIRKYETQNHDCFHRAIV